MSGKKYTLKQGHHRVNALRKSLGGEEILPSSDEPDMPSNEPEKSDSFVQAVRDIATPIVQRMMEQQLINGSGSTLPRGLINRSEPIAESNIFFDTEDGRIELVPTPENVNVDEGVSAGQLYTYERDRAVRELEEAATINVDMASEECRDESVLARTRGEMMARGEMMGSIARLGVSAEAAASNFRQFSEAFNGITLGEPMRISGDDFSIRLNNEYEIMSVMPLIQPQGGYGSNDKFDSLLQSNNDKQSGGSALTEKFLAAEVKKKKRLAEKEELKRRKSLIKLKRKKESNCMSQLTLGQMRDKKTKVEAEIKNILAKFYNETGLSTHGIDLSVEGVKRMGSSQPELRVIAVTIDIRL